MIKKKSPTDKIVELEKQLIKYQKQYDELRKQSPNRWWHDEHFDNQLKVLDAIIIDIKEQLVELKLMKLKKKSSKD